MTEREIIDLLTAHDEVGMNEFMLHYSPLMKYIIAPIVKNEHDREECLSETAMKVWDKIGQYNPGRGSFTTRLTVLVRNTALNYCRDKRDYDEQLTDDLVSSELSGEEAVLRKELRDTLADALGRLNTRDRILFYRKYYYMQSTAQIAAEVGMTERAVEGRLYRIKKRLREWLGGGRNE